MTRLQKVTDLSEPPKVGRRYLVPCVLYQWRHYEKDRWWPVFTPRHDDLEFFNFPWKHYHVDPRFVSRTVYEGARGKFLDGRFNEVEAFKFFVAPLNNRTRPSPGAVEWRTRVCQRQMPPYPMTGQGPVEDLRRHYSGQQCPRGPSGWICPHRKTPLGSFQVREDGKVECPLHGLRICAETGKVA